MIQRLFLYLDSQSKMGLLLFGLIVALTLGAIDAATGYELSLAILYLLPIVLVSWFVHKHAGLWFSGLCAIVGLAADSLSGQPYSHPLIPYWNMIVRFLLFSIVAVTVSRLRTDLKRESELARRDLLTGLPNSRSFHELTSVQVKRAAGYGRPLTLAYVVADGLHLINDRFGRVAGDQVICTMARTIEKNAPTNDLVARLGGSEFAILLPETDANMARVILGDIQRRLRLQMQKDGRPMTFSIAAVTCTQAPLSVGMLIHEAERLTDRVKESKADDLRVEVVDWAQPLQ